MALENILSQEIVQKLGWTLLHFIWQAAAVALLLAILLAVLRKSSANLRYIIACAALGLIVLLPIVTMQLVPVSVPQTTASIEPPPAPVIVPVQPTEETPLAKVVEYEEPTQLESVNSAPLASWKQRAVERLELTLPYIVSAWLLGVFGLSLWHLGGWAQLQRLRKKMIRQVDDSLCVKLRRLSERLRVKRAVQLVESALVQVPTVVGWLRPVILLPASALTGLTTEQLEALLAHELAHIRRHDYLINMLQTIVETLGFYHPVVWWISHRIRVERENCCDDLAVSISGDRICYARALTSMEEIRGRRGELAVAAAGGNLFRRIRRLIGKDTTDSSRASWIPSVITILLIAIIAIPTTLALTAKSESAEPEQLNEILKKFSDGTTADKSDNNSKSVRESVENYISAALAGEDEKAAEYAYPDTAVAAQTKDMREILQGQDAKIVGACIGEWNSLAITPIIKADHGRTGSIVFHLKKVISDQKVQWLIDDIDLETLDTIGNQISYFLNNVPDAKTIIISADTYANKQEDKTENIKPDEVVLKLVDPNSQPVVGARVGTYVDWSDIAENPPIWFLRYVRNNTAVNVKSDEHGKVTLEAEEIFGSGWTIEGIAPLTAIDEGHYLAGLREISRKDLGTEVALTLQPGCRVHGRVNAATARKRKWTANILTVYVDWQEHRPCQYSSKQGRFEFVLPPGKYNVKVYSEDLDKAITLPILIRPGQRDLDLTKYLDGTSLPPAAETESAVESEKGRIEGRIIDINTGKGISGVQLVAVPNSLPALSDRFVCTSEKDGTFAIGGLQSGEYLLRGDFPSVDVDVVSGRCTNDVLIGVRRGETVPAPKETTAEQQGDVQILIGMRIIEMPADALKDVFEPNESLSSGLLVRHGHEIAGRLLTLTQERKDAKLMAAPQMLLNNNSNGTIAMIKEEFFIRHYEPIEGEPGKLAPQLLPLEVGWKFKIHAKILEDGEKVHIELAAKQQEPGFETRQYRPGYDYQIPSPPEILVTEMTANNGEPVVIIRLRRDETALCLIVTPSVILPERQPEPLLGTKLPEPDNIQNIDSLKQAEGKRILICFWDMQQRPSRNLIGELAKREKELAEKNVAVYLVHTSKVEPAKLKEWFDNQNVPFACGNIENDATDVLFRWGVRAQPWLILTDKKGVVSAEGFSLDQLDDKLQGKIPDAKVEGNKELGYAKNSGLSKRTVGETQIVLFPKDRSLGRLYVRDSGIEGRESWEGWQELGPARGEISVSQGKELKLEVSEKTFENLADLVALRASDIQNLYICYRNLQDSDLVHLKGLTGLQSLTLSSGSSEYTCPIKGEGLVNLRGMESLRQLMIQFTSIRDESLVHLKHLTNLENLLIWNAEELTGKGLSHLRDMPSLRSISFYMVPIEDFGLENLKGMSQLEHLSLQYTNVTDEGLAHLKGLTGLKDLVLPPDTTDAGLAKLQGLASLEELNISDTKVTDDGLSHLKGLSGLKSLSVGGRNMNGRGLRHLHDLPRLKELSIFMNKMDDEGMRGLKGLTSVTSLNLARTQVSDGGLANIAELNTLKYLSLKNTSITDAGMTHLNGLTSLETLDMEGTQITDAGLTNLRGLASLQTLWLQGTDITDTGLMYLKGLQSLNELYLSHTQVNDAGLVNLKELHSLQYLFLDGTNVSGEGLAHLKGLKSLRTLVICVNNLNEAGVRHLKEMTWLHELALGEGSISESVLADLRKALPDCIIDVQEVPSRPPRPKRVPPSLVGKPLPGLKDLGIVLSPADSNEKIILVCFFDMNQRPSRNLVGELAKREKELAEKNVAVLLVHTSGIDPAKLKEWLDNQNIPFTCGSIENDADDVLFRWGVRAQPWLILTDKKGVVRAEGFSLEQLDEKLKVEESTANKSRVPLLAKSSAPSGVDKSIVRVDLSVVEVPPDSKMDRETIVEIKNLLGDKITIPDSPAAADLLRKAAEATAEVKDESAGLRVTQKQFKTLADLLVSRGYVKILMNPTLEVVEGQTAQIKTDQNSLEVTANAVKDDIIYLTVKADLSSQIATEGEGKIPIISRRSFANFVRISSGQSQIIGGMIQPAARFNADGNAKESQTPARELMGIVTASIVAPAGNATQPMETVNFQNAEAKTVIEKLAQWTGKTIIPTDELMKQKISIYSPEQMPRSEAAAMILNSLRSKGYTAEQTDETIFLKPATKEQPGIDKAQIMIETRIMTVSDTFLKDIGLDANSISDPNSWPEPAPFVLSPPDNTGTCSLILDDLNVAFLLKAIRAHKDAQILTSPRVTVLDGEKAEIFIGQETDFVSDYSEPNRPSDKPTPRIEKLKTGTSICLKPQLTPDKKNLYLDFESEIRELRGIEERKYKGKYPYQIPQVTVVNTKTSCLIPDGKTLLNGGQKITQEVESVSRVPMLGDIPILGGLFRSNTKTTEPRTLLILVKPSIDPQIKAPPEPQPLDPNDPLINPPEEKLNRSDEQK